MKEETKFILYSALSCTLLLFIISCNQYKPQKITKKDIDYVNSLRSQSEIHHLSRIDSVLSIQDRNNATIALLHFKKGVLLSKLNQHEKAINNFQLALDFFSKTDNKEYITKCYWMIGSSEAFLGNSVTANKQLHEALQYSREFGDKKVEANIYGSLAHTQYLCKDFVTSIKYTKMALEIYSDLEDTLGLSSAYNNLAVVYKNIFDYENALEYNQKSLELNQLRKDSSAIAKSYNNIANVLEQLNKDDQAIDFFQKAIETNKAKQNLNSSPLQNLGDLYLNNGEMDLAKFYYLQAIDVESEKNNTPTKLSLYNKLLQINLREKNFEEAISFQKVRDSLSNLQRINDEKEKLAILESQYKLAASKQELKTEQAINKKNKIIFITFFCLFIFLGLFWWQQLKNKILKTEKDKIQLEQKLLRSQMNPHFIFNALSSIQNSLLDDDSIKSAKSLSRFARLIRQNFDFIQQKSIPLASELDALQNYLETQQMRFENKFDYEINIDKKINCLQTTIPPLLLQPFVENSIEHGFKNKKEKGKIDINISEVGNHIKYQIIDNGKGFEVTKNDNKVHAISIFKKRLQLLGNNDEKSFEILSNRNGTTVSFKLAK